MDSRPSGLGTSEYLNAPLRSEAEVRAVRARRNQLEAQLRLEGTPERDIERLATDDVARKMLAHEAGITGYLLGLFRS